MREDRSPRAGAVYGRRKGKALRAGQAGLVDTLLPELGLDLTVPAPDDLRALFPAAVGRVELEIGFGGGEHMIARARDDPRLGTLGAEPFLNGIAKALSALTAEHLSGRFRLHPADALPLLDWLPEASLDGVRLLYPDPWPKVRHWKRRFVQADTLDRLARVMRPNAELRFASDWPDYVNWTLVRAARHTAFAWPATTADDWRAPWPGWPGTRYEAKALREGRVPAYLTFVRR